MNSDSFFIDTDIIQPTETILPYVTRGHTIYLANPNAPDLIMEGFKQGMSGFVLKTI